MKLLMMSSNALNMIVGRVGSTRLFGLVVDDDVGVVTGVAGDWEVGLIVT